MTTAFVLSGGGSLGAVQVGMLQALAAAGIRPDFLVGTSAGALNGAFVAAHGFDEDALRELELVWTGLRRRDIFPVEPVRVVVAAAGAVPSLCSPNALRRLVERHITFDRLEDLPLPLHVVTTDVRSGEEVVLSQGNPVDAIVASAAIPAVFPSVRIGGRDLVDGGIANNAAVSVAAKLGADRIYVLPSGFACALESPPSTALGSALQALTLLIEQRLILEVAHYAATVDLRIIPPLCPLRVASHDFRHGASLISRARDASTRWLADSGGHRAHPERFLSMHAHGPVPERRSGDRLGEDDVLLLAQGPVLQAEREHE
jgi:NTE family protein